jgi:DNA sulfur modification protein DndB
MKEYLGALVKGNEIKKVLTNRKNPYVYKTVSASKPELLEEKVKLEEKDGWKVSRKNKRSVRMEEAKALDELLEDEVWCVVAQMGFHELSKDRNFKIHVSDDQEPRQIDVFAKDGETGILIECTCAEAPKKKNMENLVQKIISIQSDVRNSINNHFGKSPKLKLRWIIATRNVIWSDADLEKARAARICILQDKEIDYYKGLVNVLKVGARYQFLGHIFEGEEIHGLKISVPATRGKIAKTIFYNFLIRPSDLLKISYISHKGSRDVEALGTYQRMLKKSRLNDIAEYVNDGGIFPTNIVINLKTKKDLTFDKKGNIGDCIFGELHLPSNYASAWVIDGQHRLYGYAYSDRSEDSFVPVLAFSKLPANEEARMFVDINSKQIKVSKNLYIELYCDLHWDSPDPEERLLALSSRISSNLATKVSSPIKGRVLTTGSKKSSFVCLSLTNISDGLIDNKLLGDVHGHQLRPGPLSVANLENLDASLKKATHVLSEYFKCFAEAMPEHWKLGDAPGGYLCTNNSIRSLLLVLKHLSQHLEKTGGVACDNLDANDLVSHLKPFCSPLVDFFKNASPPDIQAFRSQQGGLKGITKQAMMMMQYIHKSKTEFNPSGLKEYIDSQDFEGTKEARDLIDDIQRILFEKVLTRLKQHFGEKESEWWAQGVPLTVRQDCANLQENDPERKEKEQYITLIDYYKIAYQNWPFFESDFAFTKDGSKDRKLSWIKDLNKIRNKTHHVEKWPLSKEEVKLVREISRKVYEQIQSK